MGGGGSISSGLTMEILYSIPTNPLRRPRLENKATQLNYGFRVSPTDSESPRQLSIFKEMREKQGLVAGQSARPCASRRPSLGIYRFLPKRVSHKTNAAFQRDPDKARARYNGIIAKSKANKTHYCEVCDYNAGKKNTLAKHKESKTHIRKAAIAAKQASARQSRLSDNTLGKNPSAQGVRAAY